jgi:signal transduction histidine kinase/ActR/RegA family two-component response regulator
MLLRRSDLKVLYVTPNVSTVTGLEKETLYGDVELLSQLLEDSALRQLRQELSAWDMTGTKAIETSYTPLHGSQQEWCRLYITADEANDCYMCVMQNISREYETRMDMQEQLAQARRESQAKTDFLSQMSHEIRTPMNGIMGMLTLAKSHLDDRNATEDYLERVESLSQFLLTLINDILDMSRIESGKMELEQESFDLFNMADRLDTMFKNTAEEKGLHWCVQMQDFDVRYVVGDELRLSQVVVNFISNALKFTPAGGTVEITFRQMAKLEGKLHLMIRVRDTGKGMKKEFLKHIFKPFRQEDASTAKNYGGSGLGMAIADRIIRLMDGHIIVDSQLGQGSEFVVYVNLPIADTAQNLPAGESGASEEDEARAQYIDSFQLAGLRILLAEDNEINAEIAQELLEDEGAKVDWAQDGEVALQMFSDSQPGVYDVILMDIQMPNMDGYQATQAIRALDRDDKDLPILAMSANAFVEDKRQSIKAGMDGHVSKPVDFDELRRTVAELMYTREEGESHE